MPDRRCRTRPDRYRSSSPPSRLLILVARGPKTQTHRFRAEDAPIHGPDLIGNLERACRPGQDVLLQIHPGRDLDNSESLWLQFDDAAFGDIADLLALLQGSTSREGHGSDLLHELRDAAVPADHQAAVLGTDVAAAGGEVAAEDDRSCAGGDVGEAAHTGGHVPAAGQVMDVDVAVLVDLQ